MDVLIYHNPRCSKSRATLEILRARGIEPRVVEYLKTPPSAAELDGIVAKLGIKPQQLIRRSEAKAAGLDIGTLDDAGAIRAMAEHPAIIERPIVVVGEHARLGRPPESVLELLDA